MLIAAPHVSFPGVGRIRKDGTGYRWIPIEYGDRDRGAASNEPGAKPSAPAR